MDIQSAFARSFSSIVALVDGQVHKSHDKGLFVNGIVLVGGLGASPYLYNHLKARYDTKNIQVLQGGGVRPRTAICRGAILKGFLDVPSVTGGVSSHVSVVSTIARRNIGVSISQVFEDGVDRKRDKFWDKDEGIWRARGQMEWYLGKGQSVSTDEPIRDEYYKTYCTEEQFNAEDFSVEILHCDDESPPKTRNRNVQDLCKISWSHSSNITFDSLEYYRGENGSRLKKLEYEVVVIPSGASTQFAIYYKDMKVASHNFQITFS